MQKAVLRHEVDETHVELIGSNDRIFKETFIQDSNSYLRLFDILNTLRKCTK
jgi:hypothetical protein